jgi:DNA ligase-1
MNKPWQVIAELESDNSRLFKESIIEREARDGNKEFFEGVKLALDKLVTFGLKQIPEKTDTDGPGLDWIDFAINVEHFIHRDITGNLARDTVNTLMKEATKEQWNNWYRRILIKDLRCGVSEKTINKAVDKEYAIPVFSCQLAHDSQNHESKVSGKKLLEVKLDGVRVLTIVYPDGRVDQFSRNGKELVNFPHIKEQFSTISAGAAEPYVFDGEVMSSSFQDLMKQVHRKDNVQSNDAVLHLFDFLPLSAFETGEWEYTQEQRSAMLRQWYEIQREQLPNIRVLEQELVDLDTEEGQARYKEINKQAIDGGYEGIMIKDLDAPYQCKRSHAWLKLKPFIEVSLEVIDVEEGTGRNQGRLGAIVCGGQDDGKTIRVNVGSGFSDDNRSEFWVARDDLIGQLVEVRADAITKNQDGTYSLRFPRFLHFRGFEVGEKL